MAVYGQCQMTIPEDISKLSSFEQKEDSFSRKCKIICTMGPACWEPDMLLKLIDAGMNICRLNFSHGDHKVHGDTVKKIREAAKLRPDKPVGILLDTKGPEIRTGFFRDDVGDKIDLVQGQKLKLVTDYTFKGDNTCFAVSYEKLCLSVKPGNIILCADGSLSLRVESVAEDHVVTEVMNSVKLGERKNCNLPGVKVDLPVLQEKDVNDLVHFGIPQAVDFIAASFVQSAEDVHLIRKTLGPRGRNIKIISKIENEEGLKNIDAIIEASDAIMVARGDLGMEIPPENVFLAQKMMIAKCNVMGKPVITATQMLESMIKAPRPTRAEASDVANAVLDGSDCVMLSGETAAGDFPVNAVTIMRRVCEEAEAFTDYKSLFQSTSNAVAAHSASKLSAEAPPLKKQKTAGLNSVEAVCASAVKAAIDAQATMIMALTETGHTALLLAKYRPEAPILAISASETTIRQLQYSRGVVPISTASFQGTDSVITKGLARAKELGMVKSGDIVVAVHGSREECPGATNLMKVMPVP